MYIKAVKFPHVRPTFSLPRNLFCISYFVSCNCLGNRRYVFSQADAAGLFVNVYSTAKSEFTQLIKVSFSDEALVIALPGVC